MSTNNTTKIPIVFVHGLWLHAESWNPWIEFFHENGYEATAAS
jgi:non-heme chloroperoxidase